MRLVLTAMLIFFMGSAFGQTLREARACKFSSGFRCAEGFRFEKRKCHCVEIVRSNICHPACIIDAPGKDCRMPCP
jgi:hypothetical protein